METAGLFIHYLTQNQAFHAFQWTKARHRQAFVPKNTKECSFQLFWGYYMESFRSIR